MDAFRDTSSLKFGQGAQHVQLEPTGRRGRVDALSEGHEGYAQRVQVFEQQNQMAEIAPEPIQSPTHHGIEPASFGIAQQLIEGRAPFLAPETP